MGILNDFARDNGYQIVMNSSSDYFKVIVEIFDENNKLTIQTKALISDNYSRYQSSELYIAASELQEILGRQTFSENFVNFQRKGNDIIQFYFNDKIVYVTLCES